MFRDLVEEEDVVKKTEKEQSGRSEENQEETRPWKQGKTAFRATLKLLTGVGRCKGKKMDKIEFSAQKSSQSDEKDRFD